MDTTGLDWTQLALHVRLRHTTLRADDSALRFDVTVGKARQPLVVLASETLGLPAVTIVAMLGRADSLVERTALEHCAGLLAGGMFVRDDVYLFRVSMPLASLTLRALDDLIVYAATHAVTLRARAARRVRAVDPHAFASAL